MSSGHVVVTRPTSTTVVAFDATCTHQGCLVNAVARGTIRCPCHGSQFAVADGSVVFGPAALPLAPFAVCVVHGFVNPA